MKEINSIVKIYEPGKIYLRGKLDGHTNLFNTQALFYAVLPHRVKVINVYQMGAYFNIST